jgi:class 3 adenylate cyclase
MPLLNQLSVPSKFVLVLLTVSLSSMLIVGFVGYSSGRDALQECVSKELVGLRESKADQVRVQIGTIRSQMLSMAENPTVIQATREFLDAHRRLAGRTPPADTTKALTDFYEQKFLPELSKKIEGTPLLEHHLPMDPVACYLQYFYIARNPHPFLRGNRLVTAEDGSEYSEVHKKYHAFFRNFNWYFGYEDLMLVDQESGAIVYTEQKTPEFGTNLLDGPYSESNLGELYRSMRRARDVNYVRFADFESYRADLAKPAAFVGAPIRDGTKVIGSLIFQFPIDEFNRTLTSGQQWEMKGMGKTTEIYLVGPDRLMRTNSRDLSENPAPYLEKLKAVGYSTAEVEHIRKLETSILTQRVNTTSVEKGLRGQTGIELTQNAHHVPVLSAYAPLEVDGLKWIIIAEMHLDEAFAPITTFRQRVLTWSVVVVLMITVLSSVLAYTFTRSIRRLIEGAREVSKGKVDIEVRVDSRDEFGELAHAFNDMTRSLRSQQELLNQKVQENEDLLLNILPGSAAAKLKHGDHQISESHSDVSVLFADLVGMTELAESTSPEKAVALMNDLISALDESAELHGVEKVKTFGSSYMAVCGLSVKRVDHANRMVEFALDIQQLVRRFNQDRGLTVRVQIGINSGPVVGGVLGRTKFIYDLWGHTVNVARSLKAEAGNHAILVCQSVRERLRDLHEFERTTELELPGKGKLAVWAVKSSKGADK